MTQKKYILLVLVLFIVCMLTFYKVDAIHYDLPLLGRVIFVDPGHGGY